MDFQSQQSPVTCVFLQAESHLSILAAKKEGRGHMSYLIYLCGDSSFLEPWIKNIVPSDGNGYIPYFMVTPLKKPQNTVLVTWIVSLYENSSSGMNIHSLCILCKRTLIKFIFKRFTLSPNIS